MTGVGVIAHLPNPTVEQIVELAVAAEDNGADWLGVADAFWWRDVWLLLAAAARATVRIELGPCVTNPYLRHPFHTASALATLQEIAGPARVFVGIGAGGSELRGAAGVDRSDAPERVAALAGLLRRVAAGEPLDQASARHLDVPLAPLPILVAGKGNRMLDCAGAYADRALLWAFPRSDLDRAAARVRAAGPPRELVWAPAVDHGDSGHLDLIAVYGVLNASPGLRRQWGVVEDDVAGIRAALVAGDALEALERVPAAARSDLILPALSAAEAVGIGRSIGATSIAIPAFSVASLPDRLAWARAVASELH